MNLNGRQKKISDQAHVFQFNGYFFNVFFLYFINKNNNNERATKHKVYTNVTVFNMLTF